MLDLVLPARLTPAPRKENICQGDNKPGASWAAAKLINGSVFREEIGHNAPVTFNEELKAALLHLHCQNCLCFTPKQISI